MTADEFRYHRLAETGNPAADDLAFIVRRKLAAERTRTDSTTASQKVGDAGIRRRVEAVVVPHGKTQRQALTRGVVQHQAAVFVAQCQRSPVRPGMTLTFVTIFPGRNHLHAILDAVGREDIEDRNRLRGQPFIVVVRLVLVLGRVHDQAVVARSQRQGQVEPAAAAAAGKRHFRRGRQATCRMQFNIRHAAHIGEGARGCVQAESGKPDRLAGQIDILVGGEPRPFHHTFLRGERRKRDERCDQDQPCRQSLFHQNFRLRFIYGICVAKTLIMWPCTLFPSEV